MTEREFIYNYLEKHYTIKSNNFEMAVKEINSYYLYSVDTFLHTQLFPVLTNNESVRKTFDDWYEDKRIEYTEREMFSK